MSKENLRKILKRIDGRGYKAYKDIEGSYNFDFFQLFIDHVQGDPFAAPSEIRIRMQNSENFPNELYDGRRRIALEDYLTRQIDDAIKKVTTRKGSGKSGLICIDAGKQEVLERTSMVINDEFVEARLEVGLPAAGRRILGREAEKIFFHEIPELAQYLQWNNIEKEQAVKFVECIENQEHIRRQLDKLGLIAFVADNSILPRESGRSDKPLTEGAVPFKSPESLSVTVDVPNPINNQNSIRGMGIRKGVTLIVGGGYHGKSTLLNALERGVYPHIPEDGREYVVTSKDVVKIRAEDGRRIEQVDISPFIGNLPYGKSTSSFSTEDASGSTSQAANIVEMLEVGAKGLLLDEDTSATNFMIRDARMQKLVSKEHEPITPFIDRIRELAENGISTILVMGGSGDYFDVADTVIMMDSFIPKDVTEEARKVAASHKTERKAETRTELRKITDRIPLPESFDPSRGKRQIKIDARTSDAVMFGTEMIELRYVEQLTDRSQTRAVGYAIHLATETFMDGSATLREVVESVENFLDTNGLDKLNPYHGDERHPGNFARPRKYEIAAAINRLRTVRMRQKIVS